MAKGRTHGTLLGLLTAALSMTACDSASDDRDADRSAIPASPSVGSHRDSAVASFTAERLLTRRHELILRTRGSSTCPWRVTDVEATDGGRALTVSASSSPQTAGSLCTDDLREHREVIPLPVGVQLRQVTEVHVVAAPGGSTTLTVLDVGPESLPTRPFVLDCAPGENGSSMTYEYWLEDPAFVDAPELVAGRVLAAHPTWQVVSEETRIGADVAALDDVGDVKAILLAQVGDGGWFLSAESHCFETDLYR